MKTQWWLAELDRHGTASLHDGPHDDRSGAEQALLIIHSLSCIRTEHRRFEIAEVRLTMPTGEVDEVINQDAIDTLNEIDK